MTLSVSSSLSERRASFWLRRMADDVVEEFLPQDLAAGDVDAAEQRLVEREIGLPALEFGGGRFDGVAAERRDQAGLFGEGDELARRKQAALGMAPAHQGFETRDRAVFEAHDGLIVHLDLVAIERGAQIGVHEQTVGRTRLHLRLIDFEAAAPCPLGVIHRDFRLAQHVAAIAMAGFDRVRARSRRPDRFRGRRSRRVGSARRGCVGRPGRRLRRRASPSARTANSSLPRRATASSGPAA